MSEISRFDYATFSKEPLDTLCFNIHSIYVQKAINEDTTMSGLNELKLIRTEVEEYLKHKNQSEANVKPNLKTFVFNIKRIDKNYHRVEEVDGELKFDYYSNCPGQTLNRALQELCINYWSGLKIDMQYFSEGDYYTAIVEAEQYIF